MSTKKPVAKRPSSATPAKRAMPTSTTTAKKAPVVAAVAAPAAAAAAGGGVNDMPAGLRDALNVLWIQRDTALQGIHDAFVSIQRQARDDYDQLRQSKGQPAIIHAPFAPLVIASIVGAAHTAAAISPTGNANGGVNGTNGVSPTATTQAKPVYAFRMCKKCIGHVRVDADPRKKGKCRRCAAETTFPMKLCNNDSRAMGRCAACEGVLSEADAVSAHVESGRRSTTTPTEVKGNGGARKLGTTTPRTPRPGAGIERGNGTRTVSATTVPAVTRSVSSATRKPLGSSASTTSITSSTKTTPTKSTSVKRTVPPAKTGTLSRQTSTSALTTPRRTSSVKATASSRPSSAKPTAPKVGATSASSVKGKPAAAKTAAPKVKAVTNGETKRTTAVAVTNAIDKKVAASPVPTETPVVAPAGAVASLIAEANDIDNVIDTPAVAAADVASVPPAAMLPSDTPLQAGGVGVNEDHDDASLSAAISSAPSSPRATSTPAGAAAAAIDVSGDVDFDANLETPIGTPTNASSAGAAVPQAAPLPIASPVTEPFLMETSNEATPAPAASAAVAPVAVVAPSAVPLALEPVTVAAGAPEAAPPASPVARSSDVAEPAPVTPQVTAAASNDDDIKTPDVGSPMTDDGEGDVQFDDDDAHLDH